MSVKRCCDGTTATHALGHSDQAWAVVCASCTAVLATVEAPRDEVYAHM